MFENLSYTNYSLEQPCFDTRISGDTAILQPNPRLGKRKEAKEVGKKKKKKKTRRQGAVRSICSWNLKGQVPCGMDVSESGEASWLL